MYRIGADPSEVLHGHLFCGLGGGAKGMNRGRAQVGSLKARFRCVGGIDVDPSCIRDFTKAAGVQGAVLDLFSRDQFDAFHGREPPKGWREATPQDIRRAFHGERPHILLTSPPCKGLSGLLSQQMSTTAKYQALNALTLRGIWLALEAYADDPIELIILENVPRIANRGRALLNQICALLRAYGYQVAETTHDCGELGGLAQSRKRFLLVARHAAKVPAFLYEPPKQRLKGVGEILSRLPLPGDPRGGPMHRVPELQWRTWVRLAFVEAGADWRSLNRLRVEDGLLSDYGIVPMRNDALGVRRWTDPVGAISSRGLPYNGGYSVADPREDPGRHHGVLGVTGFDQPSGVISSNARPSTGRFAVADPRRELGLGEYGQYGVRGWTETSGAVSGKAAAGSGSYSVADPREGIAETKHNNCFRIVAYGERSPTVTAGGGPSAGGLGVADPRCDSGFGGRGKYRVTGYEEPSGVVIANSGTGQGASVVADPRTGFGPNSHRNKLKVLPFWEAACTVTGSDRVGSGALSVADPRPACLEMDREAYRTGGHFGVTEWSSACGAVPAAAKNNNGPWSVADPRGALGIDPTPVELPQAEDRLVCVIESMDRTWHRPFTSMELAALQGLIDPEELHEDFSFDGTSDARIREKVGNAIPPPAAQAIADMMGQTLLLSRTGETFRLSETPIWVRPLAVALAVEAPDLDTKFWG